MSVSAFHGGLEWQQPLSTSSKSAGLNDVISAVSGSSSASNLNTRNINEFFNPVKSDLSNEERYRLCEMVGEEIIQKDELRKLIETRDHFRCYDGFEPSGRMHIA